LPLFESPSICARMVDRALIRKRESVIAWGRLPIDSPSGVRWARARPLRGGLLFISGDKMKGCQLRLPLFLSLLPTPSAHRSGESRSRIPRACGKFWSLLPGRKPGDGDTCGANCDRVGAHSLRLADGWEGSCQDPHPHERNGSRNDTQRATQTQRKHNAPPDALRCVRPPILRIQ